MKSFFPRLSLSLLLLKQSCYGSVTLYKQETASSLSQAVNLNISVSNCHFSGLPARGEDLRSSGGAAGGCWEGGLSVGRKTRTQQAVECYRCLLVKLGSICVGDTRGGKSNCGDAVACINSVHVNGSQGRDHILMSAGDV